MLAIPTKRTERNLLTYLTDIEVDALLEACDPSTWAGRRDHALLALAIQTGLRVSELTGLTCRDVSLAAGANLRCVGKGRICGIRHMRPYVAPGTMSRRRGESPPWAGTGLVGWTYFGRVRGSRGTRAAGQVAGSGRALRSAVRCGRARVV